MILSVQDLAVARGGHVILTGLTFSLAPGQALILKGENGIGKTSLLRCLAGLSAHSRGTIDLGAEEAVYAGHLDGIKAQLSVRENLAFWGAIFASDRLEGTLAQFELTALADRPAQYLSAGQKRRLGLARLAISERRIWLLDEPTVSLDQARVGQFGAVLRAHLERGGAAVIASHIDLGLRAPVLDLGPYRADRETEDRADPFLQGAY